MRVIERRGGREGKEMVMSKGERKSKRKMGTSSLMAPAVERELGGAFRFRSIGGRSKE